MTDLLKSKEFWTGVVGGTATLLVFFVGKYFAAGLEDLQVVLNVLMPLVLFVIGTYTAKSVVKTYMDAQVEIAQAQLQMVQYQVRLAMTEQPKTRAGVNSTPTQDD